MKYLILVVCLFFAQNIIECKKYKTIQVIEQDFPIYAVAAIDGAVVDPSTNKTSIISGYVKFQQYNPNDLVYVTINVSGLISGQGNMNHGFHVHQLGINNTSDNITIRCGSCGAHFSTNTNQHGDISFVIRHTGDLGNIIVQNDGTINQKVVDHVLQLDGMNSVIGRTIVLHAKEDDKGLNPDPGSKTTGNAGARIACGVIGYNMPPPTTNKQ